ncbi:MAG TPA: hypothetical protein VK919_07880 [Solirubrobacterales bacterium]|nr:hypothetical protein [Solirubrobacterales bacterium]
MGLFGGRARRRGLLVAGATVLLVAGGASLASGLGNGGFENGNLKGWKKDSRGAGKWKVYSGTGEIVPEPPQGNYAAVSVQNNPSSNVLHRTLRLKKGVRNILKLRVYYTNEAERFATPRSLSHRRRPNQQYRIDLIKPEAGLRSMKKKHILVNIFRTKVGDPLSIQPRKIEKNISRFNGREVRLRIAQVDNQSFFSAAVDAVKLSRR